MLIRRRTVLAAAAAAIAVTAGAPGLIAATSLALVQFWPSLVPVLKVVGVLLTGLALDTALLSPRLVGKRIGLHPVWLIFALFVFSYLLGLVGALVAVPLAAAVGVLVRFALHVYLGSPLYRGAGEAAPPRGGGPA